MAQKFSLVGKDAEIPVGQEDHPPALVGPADAEMDELAFVAEGHLARGIDPVYMLWRSPAMSRWITGFNLPRSRIFPNAWLIWRSDRWSPEDQIASKEHKCPHCGAKLLRDTGWPYNNVSKKSVVHLDGYGKAIVGLHAWLVTPKGYQCRTCGGTWARWQAPDAPESPPEWKVADIKETLRSEEPIGSDSRVVSNDTEATVQRTVRIARDWTSTLTLEHTRNTTASSTLQIGTNTVGVQGAVSDSLEQRYAVVLSIGQSFEESITLTVPPQTSLRLEINWKRVWQHGDITLRTQRGAEAVIPYGIVVGVTFDQYQKSIQS